jgi:hypothetical protein
MGFLSNLRDKIRASRQEDDATMMAGVEDESVSPEPAHGQPSVAGEVQTAKDDTMKDIDGTGQVP